MQIRVGYDLTYQCPQQTPMILMLTVHPSRAADMIQPDTLVTDPEVGVTTYADRFGNVCSRIVAPAGRIRLRAEGIVHDSGLIEPAAFDAEQHAVQDLPHDVLVYLLGSRYCETDQLSQAAWNLFGTTPMGWARVQAICDFVNSHIRFDYQHARPTKTAFEVFNEKQGVCRDFAHLAIAFCRCMNIPARYCTSYLGDIGVPPVDAPMDFAGSFEAFLGGRWHSFDPRNNQRRIGRILIARGRDAADVAISTSFGTAILESFKVTTEEITQDMSVQMQLANGSDYDAAPFRDVQARQADRQFA